MIRPRAPISSRLVLVAFLFPAGCSGSARFNFASLNFNAIDPPPAQTHEYAPQECRYWIDDDGRLNLALRYDRTDWLTRIGSINLQTSLVLDGPPAGSGRDYPVTPDTVRMRMDNPIEQHRFTSGLGVVSVTRGPGKSLRGSFRLWLQHFSPISLFSLFPQRPDAFLFYGTFNAVPDANGRGRAIRAATEADGWTRSPRPAVATPPTSRRSTSAPR